MKVDLQFHLTATLCATGGFVKNTLSALHCLFFIICSSFLSFSCSKRISLVIIYQLHKQKSSFSSFFFFALREEKLWSSLKKHGESATLSVFYVTLMTAVLLPEEWRWWITATALLFWWMRAVLKVNLTFEVVTEWWTRAAESAPHHLLSDVILVCWSVLSESNNTIIPVGAEPVGFRESEPRTPLQ